MSPRRVWTEAEFVRALAARDLVTVRAIMEDQRPTWVALDALAYRSARSFVGLTVPEAEVLAARLMLTLEVRDLSGQGVWTDERRTGRVTVRVRDGRVIAAGGG